MTGHRVTVLLTSAVGLSHPFKRIKDQNEDKNDVLGTDYGLIVGVLMVRIPFPYATLVEIRMIL